MATTSKNRPYIESHSALRGIAALIVLLDHLRAFQYLPQDGFLGGVFRVFAWNGPAVFLFFILSGFVMSYVYPNPVRWHHFFVARLARLVPVYEVTLIIFLALLFYSHSAGPDISPLNVIANVLMMQQWCPIPGLSSINFPSWSLSVEAFLYVFAFPALIWTRSLPWRNGFYVVLIVVGASWESLFYDIHWPTAANAWFLPLTTGLAGFGLGFSLHSLMENGLQFPKRISVLAVALIAASLLWHMLLPSNYTRGFLTMGFTLLVVAGVDPEGLPSRVLANRFFLYLGDISYSLYLWHIVVLNVFVRVVMHVMARSHVVATIFSTNAAICVGIIATAFAAATLSYTKLEVPFRRLIRDRFVRPKPGLHQAAG